MPKNIVITGAAGFLGTYFIKTLNLKKYNVYAIDKKKFAHKNVTCLQYNISNIDKFINKLPKTIDYLYHFAAIKDVNIAEKYYTRTYKNNAYYTLLLLTKLKERVKNIIFTSSCAIYGNNKIPTKEEYQPSPINFYGLSKISAENYILTFSKIYNIRALILRIFNMYGYWPYHNTYQGVIVKFLKQIKKNKIITIFGDGNQSRDFISVYDVCKILKTFLHKFPQHKILNIGTGKDITINSLANLLDKQLKRKSIKQWKPQNEFEIYKSWSDNKKLKNFLSNKFSFTPLQKGLQKLSQKLNYFESNP